MKHLMILSILILIVTSANAQKKVQPTIFSQPNSGQLTTLTLNISTYNQNIIGEFKDELILFRDKVESVNINEEQQTLALTYNSFMLIEDLKKVFNNYGINYQLNENTTHLTNVLTQ